VTTIDIHDEWWMTRLYYLAALARAFTNIERIVVVESQQFVGTLSLSSVIRRLDLLDRRFRQFEVALRRGPAGFVDQDRALQKAEADWTRLFVDEHASPVKVTRPNLNSWFGDALVGGAIEVAQMDQTTLLELLRIMSYPMDFVPITARTTSEAQLTDEQNPQRSVRTSTGFCADGLHDTLAWLIVIPAGPRTCQIRRSVRPAQLMIGRWFPTWRISAGWGVVPNGGRRRSVAGRRSYDSMIALVR